MSDNRYKKGKLNDWIIYCDICAQPTWYSQAILLDTYTGRGGLLVCPEDADPIDYGLVPYKIPAEEPIDTTRINHYATDPQDVPTTFSPFDFAAFDPMSTSPQKNTTLQDTWDKLTLLTWDQWFIYWNQTE